MSVEALWSIRFSALGSHVQGVVIFETNRIIGGDSDFYYMGEYQVNDGYLIGWLRVENYSASGSLITEGIKPEIFDVSGPIRKGSFQLTGTPRDGDGSKFPIKFRRLADLP
ncbi:GrlR family regulatory protein [Thiohalorhabdus sp.]|uniref:GrlR family regulatory protein n=1 Tax=Thiohalorhabdus sp. TaxID=3094134 RepID=UPI002FC3D867